MGRYQLIEKLAAGGMASVYLGRALGMAGFERLVAVKVCHPHLRDDAVFAAMFLDEARLAARVHHPNVTATLDVGDDGALLYLVLEYVEGGRLVDLIRAAEEPPRVPAPVVLRVMLDALTGLHAAHETRDARGAPLDLVHRDVAPQNVLVGADGVSRITDFGIAKATARATVTRDGQLKGRLGYIAPEVLAGQPPDRRADVYAAGVVLWEALAGERLFAGETEAATVRNVLDGVVPRLAQIAPELPPSLDGVVQRALAHDPAARFASAGEFAEALEGLGVPVASTRAVGEHVRRVLAAELTARRDRLHALDDAPSAAPSGHTLARVGLSRGTERPAAPARWRRVGVPVAAAMLVAGVGVAAVTASHANRPRAPRDGALPAAALAHAPVPVPNALPSPLPAGVASASELARASGPARPSASDTAHASTPLTRTPTPPTPTTAPIAPDPSLANATASAPTTPRSSAHRRAPTGAARNTPAATSAPSSSPGPALAPPDSARPPPTPLEAGGLFRPRGV